MTQDKFIDQMEQVRTLLEAAKERGVEVNLLLAVQTLTDTIEEIGLRTDALHLTK